MPSLAELVNLVAQRCADAGCQCPDRHWYEVTAELRETWSGQRVYIPPPNSRKDAARAEQIRRAAARLPTGVVASTFNVSESYVRKVWKSKT